MNEINLKLSFRVGCPSTDRRAYLPYEEEMKKRRGEKARGFYWEENINEHPIIEHLKEAGSIEELQRLLHDVKVPSDDNLPEGYQYQAVKVKAEVMDSYLTKEGKTTTSISLSHMVEKESYVKEIKKVV